MVFRRRDLDAHAAHLAEQAAFGDTALDWKPGAEALCGEGRSFMESLWWTSTFGARRCGIEPVQRPTPASRSSCLSIAGGVIEIRLVEQAGRHEVFHQLAHAATVIVRRGQHLHGDEWRTWYVSMVDAAYGGDWARRLADAFTDAGLTVGSW